MDIIRFDDNDYIQEECERLIGRYKDDEHPHFLLDEDYFVKWANDAAERLYPELTQSDGILNLLKHYPEEWLELDNVKIMADITLEERDNLHLSIRRASIMDDLFTFYMAYIYKKIDLSTLPRQEVEKRVSEAEQHYREPLSRIFLTLKRLKISRDDPDMEDCCDRMASNSVQLLRGTNMIAEHTRLSQGIMKHAPQTVDLAEFTTELFQTAAELMYMESVDLCFITPNSPLIVCTEPEYILSSVGQLLSNAIRYRLSGTPIRAKCTTDQSHIKIEIANRGVPIPQEVRAKMFDANYTYNPDGESISGNGLGLTVAKLYAELMGGSLTFEQPGENSVFRLSLPLPPSDDTDLWQMNKLELKTRLCVILADAIDTSDEILSFIG